ncbi:MAG: ABC transporter ATP-binding protein [Candidatus Taylorbacteria bacterium]
MSNPEQKSMKDAHIAPAPARTPAISVKSLSKQFVIPHEKTNSLKGAFVNIFRKNTYERFYALKDVSFEVKKGEFFGILGRNGSGKSTLLKILAGVYTPSSGAVKIGGLVSPFLELGIGFNPELSGRDNIYLNATVLGLCEKEIDAKFDSIVAFSELARFIDQKIKNYSSGMQVRLAFSVAIHANREILLMDEVLAVGDSNFQSKCLREFARYKEMGKTVILVTHDIATVQRYCDRAMLLRAGEVAMIGTAEEVGNEYIYQNMSDEEKRIVKEQEAAKVKASRDAVNARKDADNLKGQALEDERTRQAVEQKRQEEERKNKVAEITGVEFLDRDGKVKNVFETGEVINIVVTNKFYKEVKDPIFGVIIKSLNGVQLFVTNTEFKKMVTGTMPVGGTEVVFEIKNRLATGTYSITPAIADVTAKIFFDWKDNLKQLNIINRDYNSFGTSDFEHKIIIKK